MCGRWSQNSFLCVDDEQLSVWWMVTEQLSACGWWSQNRSVCVDDGLCIALTVLAIVTEQRDAGSSDCVGERHRTALCG